jgi:hypothetical protein
MPEIGFSLFPSLPEGSLYAGLCSLDYWVFGRCQSPSILKNINFRKLDLFLKNVIFWDVTPRGSCKNRRFGGSYRLHVLGVMEATRSSETSVLTRATQNDVPEDDIVLSHRREIDLFLSSREEVGGTYSVGSVRNNGTISLNVLSRILQANVITV